jgi:MFS family permease
VNVAFPSIEHTFGGTSRAELSWVLSAYNITFAALLLTAGRLGDLTAIAASQVGVFTGASVLCAVAPTAATLIVARALQAIGGALLAPSSLALLLAEFPVERRSMAIGVWGATGAIAAVVGPSSGARGSARVWRLTFLSASGLAAWLFGRQVLRESERIQSTARPDFVAS